MWREVCAYAADVQLLLPSAEVLCIAPHVMDLEQQLLMVASGAPASSAKHRRRAVTRALSHRARHAARRPDLRAHVFSRQFSCKQPPPTLSPPYIPTLQIKKNAKCANSIDSLCAQALLLVEKNQVPAPS